MLLTHVITSSFTRGKVARWIGSRDRRSSKFLSRPS